jgi:DNA modification methylase
MNPINQIVQGDCVQLLKSLPDAVIDLVVTDPPARVNDFETADV